MINLNTRVESLGCISHWQWFIYIVLGDLEIPACWAFGEQRRLCISDQLHQRALHYYYWALDFQVNFEVSTLKLWRLWKKNSCNVGFRPIMMTSSLIILRQSSNGITTWKKFILELALMHVVERLSISLTHASYIHKHLCSKGQWKYIVPSW
jgi:hypothetical protein